MFTFKWLAVPSICAALLFAPTSTVLADSGTHGKKAKAADHKPTVHKKSKKSVAAMSVKRGKEDAPATKATKTVKAAKTKSIASKKPAMSSTAPSTSVASASGKTKGKGKKGKHKTHKHA